MKVKSSVSSVTMTVEFDRPCTALLEYVDDLVKQGNSLDDVMCALGAVVGRLMAQGQPAFLQGLAAGTIVSVDEFVASRRSNCGDCIACLSKPPWGLQRMVVCPDCGNKRCPHATHHDNACTRSNEPGQEESVYR